MRNRSSRSRAANRALAVVLLACLSGCTFLQNEFLPLDAAPQRLQPPAVAVEGP